MPTKLCKRCWIAKSNTDFYKWKLGKDGYSDWCKDCRKVHDVLTRETILRRLREYYQANKDRLLAMAKVYHSANPEVGRKANRAYRLRNLDKLRAANIAYFKRNYEKNKLAIYENVRKRRARKKNAPGIVTPVEWAFVKALFDGCFYCPSKERITQDHMIPLVRGGSHTIENIVPACVHCNSRKRTLTTDEYLAKQG